MHIVPIDGKNRLEVNTFLIAHWFSTTMAVRGQLFDMTQFDGCLAVEGGEIVGLITWRQDGDALEIMSLDSVRENRGVGTALLEAAVRKARALDCSRVVLITTNDNLRALRFYENRGFAIKEVYPNAVAAARRLKPEIPLQSDDGLPIRDEIELEMRLQTGNSPVA